MANRAVRSRQGGFSLAELMVSLLFTGLLMAGMARVYKASLTSFQTSAERLSAGRRSRVAIDMLSDDLNAAGMFMWDLSKYPTALSTSNPGFWVNPNVSLALSDGTVKSDQIFFYFDEPLPFEAKMAVGAGGSYGVVGLSNNVATGQALTAANTSFTIDTGDPSFATMIKKGQRLVVKDGWPGFIVAKDPVVSGSLVTVDPGIDSLAPSGTGNPMQNADGSATGANVVSNPNHKVGAPVTFMNVAQSVLYTIQSRATDPADPAHTVPCLVRQQGPYDPSGFTTVTSTQVLAEDVSDMKVYLSVDGGRTWLRETAATGLASGWNSGYRTKVEAALTSGYGRTNYMNLSDPAWFREIPVLVRVDVTTRTSMQRTENTNVVTPTMGYKEQVHSLVIRPRHFGLSFN